MARKRSQPEPELHEPELHEPEPDAAVGDASAGDASAGDASAGDASAGDASADHVDALPDDLDATSFVGPYEFPDIRRRRILAVVYALSGAVMLGSWLAGRGPHAVAVNRGIALGGVLLLLLGLYHWVAGWPLKTDQTEALAAASRQVGFPVGHASAQLGWRGLLSRPTWRILLYSADTPPSRRGLVLVDGVDASVVGHIVEDNPEDWSEYDG